MRASFSEDIHFLYCFFPMFDFFTLNIILMFVCTACFSWYDTVLRVSYQRGNMDRCTDYDVHAETFFFSYCLTIKRIFLIKKKKIDV